MKLNTVKIITTIMLVFSLFTTAIFALFTVVIELLSRALPPIIIFSLLTVAFVWIDIFYINSRKMLTEKPSSEKKLRRLKRQTLILTTVMFTFSFSLCCFLLGLVVIYRLIIWIEIYYLIFALITAFYSINGILIYNEFFKK